jgi:UDPglucose 6-dehydrogenase
MEESAIYWQSVLDINLKQKMRIAEVVTKTEKSEDQDKLAIFGFSYKKNTSDSRSTPVALILSKLVENGFNLSVHDP